MVLQYKEFSQESYMRVLIVDKGRQKRQEAREAIGCGRTSEDLD